MENRKAFEEVCSFLNVKLDSELAELFSNGFAHNLLNYEKLGPEKSKIPAIQKFLIGFDSYIRHNENPSQYYDISRACRHSLTLQFLHSKIPFISKITNYEDKINKLVTLTSYDEFESTIFELFVGAQYAKLNDVSHVEFLPEAGDPTPDLLVRSGKDILIECKRMNRQSDDSFKIREKIRNLNSAYRKSLPEKINSILFSANFLTDPRGINEKDWVEYCNIAVRNSFCEADDVVLLSQKLPIFKPRDYVLFPSPQFYERCYDFREGEPWTGISQSGKYQLADVRRTGGMSTWLDEASDEVVLKWKLSSPEALRAYTKINFGLASKGLKQLSSYPNSILHFCFERNKAAGHRQDNLFKLCNEIISKHGAEIGWLVFNEIQFEVTFEGRFDLVEHAHIASGKRKFGEKPLVGNVFTEALDLELGEFGIGMELPNLDEVPDDYKGFHQYKNPKD